MELTNFGFCSVTICPEKRKVVHILDDVTGHLRINQIVFYIEVFDNDKIARGWTCSSSAKNIRNIGLQTCNQVKDATIISNKMWDSLTGVRIQ